MKRMLFNATQSEELRVAIVDGTTLIDLDIETSRKEQRKSNIYKGIITRIEPSLEAAFVDYGADRHGFLPFKEISRSYFKPFEYYDFNRLRIQDVLVEGQEVIIQVMKDERGTKGAALTTFISLAGRYLVLMPNNPRGGGISRRIEGEERSELRDILSHLTVPQGMSLIARTAGIGRSFDEVEWDFAYLLSLWQTIDQAAQNQSAPFLIYQEGSLVIRAIRDYFQPDITEILIDAPSVYEQAVQFMSHVMPHNIPKLKLYRDATPLFTRFQVEHQIETAYAREVPLPSGGAIVIDHTEALVSVDVNSGRATRGADIEHTAVQTNIEAAEEIARQLRLRDLGGLVVIDFIDMDNPRNQREVENRLREALHTDRARVQMGKISRFGLLELSRQRLQPSIGDMSYQPCPHCHGTGHVRSNESFSLHVLRIIEEEAVKEGDIVTIYVQLPIQTATYLLNEKRQMIHQIEARSKRNIVLIPNAQMEIPHYEIKHISVNEQFEPLTSSHELIEQPNAQEELAKYHSQYGALKRNQQAVVQSLQVTRKDTQRYLNSLAYEDSSVDFDDHFFNPSHQYKPQQEQKSQPQQGNPYNMNNPSFNQEYQHHRRSQQHSQMTASHYHGGDSGQRQMSLQQATHLNAHLPNQASSGQSHAEKEKTNAQASSSSQNVVLTEEQQRNEEKLKTIINIMRLMRKSAEIPDFPINSGQNHRNADREHHRRDGRNDRNDRHERGDRNDRRGGGRNQRNQNQLDAMQMQSGNSTHSHHSTSSSNRKPKDNGVPAILMPYTAIEEQQQTNTATSLSQTHTAMMLDEQNFENDSRNRRPKKGKKERTRDRYLNDLADEPLIVHLGNKASDDDRNSEQEPKSEGRPNRRDGRNSRSQRQQVIESQPKTQELLETTPVLTPKVATPKTKVVERIVSSIETMNRPSFDGLFFPIELIQSSFESTITTLIQTKVSETIELKEDKKPVDLPIVSATVASPAIVEPVSKNENIGFPKKVEVLESNIIYKPAGIDAILDLSLDLITQTACFKERSINQNQQSQSAIVQNTQATGFKPSFETNPLEIIYEEQFETPKYKNTNQYQAIDVSVNVSKEKTSEIPAISEAPIEVIPVISAEESQAKLNTLLNSLLGDQQAENLQLVETRNDLAVNEKQVLDTVNPIPAIDIPENVAIRQSYLANKLESEVENLVQIETRSQN